jgi:hypothetical protein
MKLSGSWNRFMEGARFKYMPTIARWMARNSTNLARSELKRIGPISLLVDNTVLQHSVTHETAQISTGVKKWGSHDVPTGYAARIAVHPADSTSIEYQNIQYLPGIVHLAREGLVNLKTSAELWDEQFHQPVGRFRGYGYFDYCLFNGLRLESVDGHAEITIGPCYWKLPSGRQQQLERLARRKDALYLDLVRLLGPRNSLDAWHIRTAEAHGLFCFLTMDFRLLRNVSTKHEKEPLKSLHTRIMSPLQFGRHFRMLPVQPHVFAYTNASWPVRPELCWPDGKRRPRKSYRVRN